MIIRAEAYPRAGLIGNPSDGYYGKTISFCFSDFHAQVVLYETPELKILPHARDHSRFSSVERLVEDVKLYGYYGGIRLLKATVKRFWDYCRDHEVHLHSRNFTIRYYSNIPHMVGLAGSSAIITACLRALMQFYEVQIPRPEQANLVLSVERDELGISAGLQDRVAQVYQGLVFMDFNEPVMKRQGYGEYEELDVSRLAPLYIGYRSDLSQGSEVVHNDMRERFLRGAPEVLDAIRFWCELTDLTRGALEAGDYDELGRLMNANFDKRAEICEISDGNLRMVKAARAAGASAKFTGSGGAIVGVYKGDSGYRALEKHLAALNVNVIKPTVLPSTRGV